MKAAGGSIEYVTKHDLNLVVDNRPHQVSQHSLMDAPEVQTAFIIKVPCPAAYLLGHVHHLAMLSSVPGYPTTLPSV